MVTVDQRCPLCERDGGGVTAEKIVAFFVDHARTVRQSRSAPAGDRGRLLMALQEAETNVRTLRRRLLGAVASIPQREGPGAGWVHIDDVLSAIRNEGRHG